MKHPFGCFFVLKTDPILQSFQIISFKKFYFFNKYMHKLKIAQNNSTELGFSWCSIPKKLYLLLE